MIWKNYKKCVKPVDISAFIRYNMQHNKKQRRELVVQGSPKESSRLVRGAGVVLYEALPEPRTEREPR
jgi:hypothetical protein